jgi:uncharacterized protein (DUF433 family)
MPEADVLAFSADQVNRLTGLSPRRLRYWERTGFFAPEYVARQLGTRIYSFRDLVGLYTVARLRKDYRFSLQELRPIGEYLHRHHATPWASLGFYLQRGTRSFAFREPNSPEAFVSIRPVGQDVIPFEMERVANDVKDRVRELRQRRPEQVGMVERRRRVVRNAPVLAGTRVPTAAVWSFHQAGYRPEQIMREYPTLTREDVEAAITYESEQQRKKKAAG